MPPTNNFSMKYRWVSSAITHPGHVRQTNEDACVALPEQRLWAVADGMGGHDGGDVASQKIVEALEQIQPREILSEWVDSVEDALEQVNTQLLAIAAEGGHRTMGSTVAVMLGFEQKILCLWAGDSRLYRMRDGHLKQLTRDHSQVEELVLRGELARASAENHPLSHVITRAVGGTEELFLDPVCLAAQAGDRYMLCTDGLYKELTNPQIAQLLRADDTEQTCKAINDDLLSGQARDNFALAIVDVLDGHKAESAATDRDVADQLTDPESYYLADESELGRLAEAHYSRLISSATYRRERAKILAHTIED